MLKKRPEPTAYNPSIINVEDAHGLSAPSKEHRPAPSSNQKNSVGQNMLVIDKNRDLDAEELIRSYTIELASAKSFDERKAILNKIFRKANLTKKAGHIHRFLIYQLICEYSKATLYKHKFFALSTMKRAFEFCTSLEYEFKKTIMETLMLHLEIEENHDHIVF
jgi:hypothetical protein